MFLNVNHIWAEFIRSDFSIKGQCHEYCYITPTIVYFQKRQWHPLQYSCLENPMDGGAWWAAFHGVATSRSRLSNFTFTFTQRRRKWNPLQCSSLENPRDGRAWWAAIYGVAQSRTRLKRLSSSSIVYFKHAIMLTLRKVPKLLFLHF